MNNEQKIEDLFKAGNIELAVILMINNPIDNLYDLMDLWVPVYLPAKHLFELYKSTWEYYLNHNWQLRITNERNRSRFYILHKSNIVFSQINIGKLHSDTKRKYLIKLINYYIKYEKFE